MEKKHFYQNIEGWSTYKDQGKLLELMLSELDIENKLNIAEIGVYKGKCTAMWNIILSNLNIEYNYYAIDHFLGSREHNKDVDYYGESLVNLDPIINKINLIRNDSVSQSILHPKQSLDIVYIDASHEYIDIKKDIIYWFPKVKKNGYICGDDYFHDFPGVKRAVNEIFKDKVERFGKRQWLVKK